MIQGAISQKLETVFIIEDEALLCDLICEYIKTIPGLDIIGTSGDGQEAIRDCLELKPDLIILDIRLPEVNGDDQNGVISMVEKGDHALLTSASMCSGRQSRECRQ